MAFRYINPGYASLFNSADFKQFAVNPTNGVSAAGETRHTGITLPEDVTDAWIKFDFNVAYKNQWYMFRAFFGNSCGLKFIYREDGGNNYDVTVLSNGDTALTKTVVLNTADGNVNTVLMHCKAGTTDGILKIIVNDAVVCDYTGKIVMSGNTDIPANKIEMTCEFKGNDPVVTFSNIIISDQPIALNEHVYIVPAKSVETTWIKDDAGNYNTDTAGAELLQIPDMSSFPGGNNITGIAIAADGVTGTTPITSIFVKDGAETQKGTLTPTASASTDGEVSWTESVTSTELANRKFGWKAGA
jgi:hypothetical protein